MNVLHLYAGNLYGGIERVLGTLARSRHLAPGMTPSFGLCFRGRLWDELAAAGVPVYDLGEVRVRRPWTVLAARRRLRRVLRESRADVAVCHACWPHAVFGPAVRAGGVRLAGCAHDTLRGTNWIERWAGRTPPDVVVANSRHTAAAVPTVFPGVRCEVVYTPLEPPPPPTADARRRVRAALDTPADDVVILMAARLEVWKGAAVFVEALGRLAGVPGWTAWLAGGPQKAGEAEYLAGLRTSARAAGIDGRVRLLGQRSDVADLMAAADIYCQPNTGPEPFGVVFVEALTAGRPVVTRNSGGGAEVVTPACGVLTPPGDAAAVAEALRGLIADPGRRQALGAAGPARAAELCDPARQLEALRSALTGGAA